MQHIGKGMNTWNISERLEPSAILATLRGNYNTISDKYRNYAFVCSLPFKEYFFTTPD
jgi:hypothetical protein